MQYILDSGQMKQCDANTMERYGRLSAVLMERAALAGGGEALRYLPEKRKRFLIVCGTGNNGGDGLAIARLLFLKGQEVTILFPGKEEKCTVEAASQLGIMSTAPASTATLIRVEMPLSRSRVFQGTALMTSF